MIIIVTLTKLAGKINSKTEALKQQHLGLSVGFIENPTALEI